MHLERIDCAQSHIALTDLDVGHHQSQHRPDADRDQDAQGAGIEGGQFRHRIDHHQLIVPQEQQHE